MRTEKDRSYKDDVSAAADHARAHWKGPAPKPKLDPSAAKEGDPNHCALCAKRATEKKEQT